MNQPIQLTFGTYGHTLHHCQIMSPDNQWIVYDTRNEDSQIGTTTCIERVNVQTKAIEVLYETTNHNSYGPGVGAATYSPMKERVIFIHGINFPTKENPYGMARRTAVAIDVNHPNMPIHMDARNTIYPFTKGALRGGTHSHCWHPAGELVSFTYNDEVLSNHERVVGVMFPKKVDVEDENSPNNFSGEMFSVVITQLVDRAKNGSDEIEKAFDECWLGEKKELVFQGWIRDDNGDRKTEIFKATLPDDLTVVDSVPLEGTEIAFPGIPKGVIIERVTRTPKGVSDFRHWLRSSPDGENVYFLMEDEYLCTNIFELSIKSGHIRQVTFHENSIHSPINISTDGTKFTYLCNQSLIVLNHFDTYNPIVLDESQWLYGIPNFDKNGQFIYYNKYVEDRSASKHLQIFKIEL